MPSKRRLTPQLLVGGLALLVAGGWLLQSTPPRGAQPRVVRKVTRPAPVPAARNLDGQHVPARG